MKNARRFVSIAIAISAIGCSGSMDGGLPLDPGDRDRVDDDGGTPSGDGGAPVTPGSDGATPMTPPPDPYTLEFDFTNLQRFVESPATSAEVRASVTASEGLNGVEVDGAAAVVAEDGSFTSSVAVVEGLNFVPMFAHDDAGHDRSGHRSIIVADFLPEEGLNPRAARIALDQNIVDSMAAPLASEIASLDLASEILSRGTLAADDRCTTWPTSAGHGTPQFQLLIDANGDLWVDIYVPNLVINFSGQCRGLIRQIPIYGYMATNIQIYSRISAPETGGCITGFDHTPPYVELPGFAFDVQGEGLVGGFVISLFSGGKAEEAQAQFQAEFTTRADTMLGERLADIHLFDGAQSFTLFERDLGLELCLTRLANDAGTLSATVGSRVAGPGTIEAPGAPMLGGATPPAEKDVLLLDTQLIGQLMYSAWRAGGLSKVGGIGGDPIEARLLGAITPGLRGRYEAGVNVDVSTEAELPPVVRAAPAESDADLIVEIGDMMLDLSVQNELLFQLNAKLTLELSLEPGEGGLVPTILRTTAEAHLVSEPVADATDTVLEQLVTMRIPEAASGLLTGAAIRLPDLGGAIVATAVAPDPGGRYLRITTE